MLQRVETRVKKNTFYIFAS